MQGSVRRLQLSHLKYLVFAVLLLVSQGGVAITLCADDTNRVDLYGDPLPAGASVSLGTARYRSSGRMTPPLFIAGDEKLIVSGHRQLGVMEVATGKRVRAIDLGEEGVDEVCLPGDRRSAFTLGTDWSEGIAVNTQVVSRWDLSSGELLGSLRFKERSGCDHFAVTPGGETVVTGSGDGTIRVWDFASGREIATVKLDRGVDSLALAPDGKLIAVGCSNRIVLWAWSAELEPESFDVGRQVRLLAFSPDGAILAEGSRTEIVLRDLKSRKVLRTLWHATNNSMYVSALVFSADGRSVAAANRISTWESRIHVWDVSSGEIQHQLPSGSMRPVKLALSADGRWLAAAGFDATTRIWDLKTGRRMGAEMPVHDGSISSVHLARDGKTAVTAADDWTVRVWDATTGKERHRLQHGHWVRGCALSPNGELVASSSLDDTVRVWDAATGKMIHNLPGHGTLGGKRALAFSADQSRLASFGDDFNLRVWDVTTGKALTELLLHPPELRPPDKLRGVQDRIGDVDKAVFSGDARLLLLAHSRSIYFFDASNGRFRSRFTRGDGHLISLAVSPDGERIATACTGPSVQRVLDDGTGRVSASQNHIARVVDIVADKELFTVPLPNDGAGPLAFSADGKRLAVVSTSSNASIQVLDAMTGDELVLIQDVPSLARAVCFSGDGRRLACGFADGTVLTWDLKLQPRSP